MVTIAAWKWKWSLTQRWTLFWTPRATKAKVYFLRTYRYRSGYNFIGGISLPLLGTVQLDLEPNFKLTVISEEIK